MSKDIVRALTLAFQYCGQPMPDAAIEEMATDLMIYPKFGVLTALKRCRSELRSIKFTDILDRIPGGHPGPEQAWAMIAKAMADESVSLIWSDEMRIAYGAARAVADDDVASRMTFKEVYMNAVAESRASRQPIQWMLSQGTDKAMRQAIILQGVQEGKLTAEYARRQLPDPTDEQAQALLAQYAPRLLV